MLIARIEAIAFDHSNLIECYSNCISHQYTSLIVDFFHIRNRECVELSFFQQLHDKMLFLVVERHEYTLMH